MRVFWLYFWKSYYMKTKEHHWCIQWKGRRIIVNDFVILVPVTNKSRKRNPHAVLYGKASSIVVNNKVAVIS